VKVSKDGPDDINRTPRITEERSVGGKGPNKVKGRGGEQTALGSWWRYDDWGDGGADHADKTQGNPDNQFMGSSRLQQKGRKIIILGKSPGSPQGGGKGTQRVSSLK